MNTRPSTPPTAVLLFAAVMSAATLAAQEATPGAKALFFNPGSGSTPPAVKAPPTGAPAAPQPAGASPRSNGPARSSTPTPPRAARRPAAAAPVHDGPIGVRYWVELVGAGPVPDTRTFRTGERIRLHVQPNASGYLTLWSVDPSGRGQLLLPSGGAEPATISANAVYDSPAIAFQEPASDERLVLSFSRRKPPRDAQLPQLQPSTSTIAGGAGPSGARSLIVEVEDRDQSEMGTYVVNKDGGAVTADVRLRHRAR